MYIIIQGEYSDWDVQGYVETEEEAIRICAEHNDREIERVEERIKREGEGWLTPYDYWNDWYYQEIYPMDHTAAASSIYMKYLVLVNKVSGITRVDKESYTLEKREVSISETDWCYRIELQMKERVNDEKVEKIAADYLAQYKANKAGI